MNAEHIYGCCEAKYKVVCEYNMDGNGTLNWKRVYSPASVAWTGLGMLCVLYLVAYADRLVLGLLVDPIKISLHITDVQIGFLMGPAFTVFYGIVGLPIALLADTGNRRRLVIAGVFFWGSCTLATSFAETFWLFVILRIGLAVGEAVLTPTAMSLIADWFSPRKRAVPATTYMWSGQMGGILGVAGLALLVREVVEKQVLREFPLFSSFLPWQIVFFFLGGGTILLGLIAIIVFREPNRVEALAGSVEEDLTVDNKSDLSQSVSFVLRHSRIYIGVIVGGSLNSVLLGAFAVWGVQLIHRNYGWAISDAGFVIGGAYVTGAVAGFMTVSFVILPKLMKRLDDRRGASHGLIYGAMASSLVGNLLLAFAAVAPSSQLFLALTAMGIATVYLSALLPSIALPIIAPPRMRAFVSAINVFVVSAVALSLGPILAPLFAKLWFSGFGERALSWGIFACGIWLPLITIPLLSWARRPFTAVMSAQLGYTTGQRVEGIPSSNPSLVT